MPDEQPSNERPAEHAATAADTPDKPASEYLRYIAHDNGIHEFIFYKSSRDTVDEHFVHLERITSAMQRDDVLLVLTNATDSGAQSITYSFQRVRRYIDEFPNRPIFKYAVLQKPDALTTLVKTLFKGLRLRTRDALGIFSYEERDEAVAWLLEQKR